MDLKQFSDRQKLSESLAELYSDIGSGTLRNWTGQIFVIAHRMEIGDWVMLPSKFNASIHIGKVTGQYVFEENAQDPFYHHRQVEWFAKDIPRSSFDQDILYSLGAFMTVCQIHRNDAEQRIKAMAGNNWLPEKQPQPNAQSEDADIKDSSADAQVDLEGFSNDQITKLIGRKFKGHRMEALIESILQAKGYVTYHSPEGPDKGIDLLAASGQMGFGEPRICVQVKSGDSQVDRPTLDQLVGAIHNFKADFGLLVAWGGFKASVEKERANQFFKVRLWGQKEIVHEFLANYDKLDEEIKTEIPLKRIWALSLAEGI
jgi:restriction system protein